MPRSALLARWVAGLLVGFGVAVAVAIVMERGTNGARLRSRASRHRSKPLRPQLQPRLKERPGMMRRSNTLRRPHSIAIPLDAATHDESNERARELLFGLDLENPVLVWGFVVVSFAVGAGGALAGQPALLVAIVLAGIAAILDGREVLLQIGRANPAVASLAGTTAALHLAVVVVAFIAWQIAQSNHLHTKEALMNLAKTEAMPSSANAEQRREAFARS